MANESETVVLGASSFMSDTRSIMSDTRFMESDTCFMELARAQAIKTSVGKIDDTELRIICDVMARWPGVPLKLLINTMCGENGRVVYSEFVGYDDRRRFPGITPMFKGVIRRVPEIPRASDSDIHGIIITYCYINPVNPNLGYPSYTVTEGSLSATVVKASCF